MHKMRIISPRATTRLKELMIVCNTKVKGNAKGKVHGQLSRFPALGSFLTHTPCALLCRFLPKPPLQDGQGAALDREQLLWMVAAAWLSRAADVATRSDLIKNSKAGMWSSPNCTHQAQQVRLCYQTFSSIQTGKQLHFQPGSGITAKISKEGMERWGKERAFC